MLFKGWILGSWGVFKLDYEGLREAAINEINQRGDKIQAINEEMERQRAQMEQQWHYHSNRYMTEVSRQAEQAIFAANNTARESADKQRAEDNAKIEQLRAHVDQV